MVEERKKERPQWTLIMVEERKKNREKERPWWSSYGGDLPTEEGHANQTKEEGETSVDSNMVEKRKEERKEGGEEEGETSSMVEVISQIGSH